jgi:hypothetical protein
MEAAKKCVPTHLECCLAITQHISKQAVTSGATRAGGPVQERADSLILCIELVYNKAAAKGLTEHVCTASPRCLLYDNKKGTNRRGAAGSNQWHVMQASRILTKTNRSGLNTVHEQRAGAHPTPTHLSVDPSGSTSERRSLKSCSPGLSLTYTAAPLTALQPEVDREQERCVASTSCCRDRMCSILLPNTV